MFRSAKRYLRRSVRCHDSAAAVASRFAAAAAATSEIQPDEKQVEGGGTAVTHPPATERNVNDPRSAPAPGRVVEGRGLSAPRGPPATSAAVSQLPGHAGRTARLPARRGENVQGVPG